MRLRGHYKNYKKPKVGESKDDETQPRDSEVGEKKQKAKKVEKEREAGETKFTKEAKEAKPVKPLDMIRQLMGNPNFNMQLMVILLSLSSENIQMDRRIDGMTTTIEKVRNITELVNNGVQSMKAVSEVPKSIRRLLE